MGYVRDRWTDPNPSSPGRRIHNEHWGKGSRWQAVWTINGVRRAKTFAVKDAATRHVQKVETGQISAVATMTFGEACQRWRESSAHHKKNTRDTIDQTTKTMILPVLGSRLIGSLDRAELQAVVNGWMEHGYSASRIEVAWSYIVSPLKLAVIDGLIPANPGVGVKLPKRAKRRVVPLTTEQVAYVSAHVPKWYQAMVFLDAATGLRSGELRGLTWDRVEGMNIVVDRQLIDTIHGQPVFDDPKTAASNRIVPVGKSVIDMLNRHRKEWPEDENGLIFHTRQHGAVGRGTANDSWRNAIKDRDDFRERSGWHDLRHFHASLLIAEGLSVRAVADRLGHDDPAETLRTYSHLWPTDQTRAVAVTEAALEAVFG